MLGKLIKYDLKELNRFLVIIHAFLILSMILVRVLLTGRIQGTGSEYELPLMLSFLLCFLFMMSVSFATYIVIAVRFYKNLYSDEGYLSHTLPVTHGQHLLSKTISGCIWSFIDTFCIFLSCYIVIATPYIMNAFHTHKSDIFKELGFTGPYANMSLTSYIILFVFITCIGTISNVVTIYASIVLGQLFSGHRVVGAIASYFALTTIISVISLATFTLSGVFSTVAMSDTFVTITVLSFKFTIVLEVIITFILYVMTYYLMKKKINII